MYKPREFTVKDSRIAIALAQRTGKIPYLATTVHEIRELLARKEKKPETVLFVRAILCEDRKKAREEYLLSRDVWSRTNKESITGGLTKIMFEMSIENGNLHFKQVPGVHDVCAAGGYDPNYRENDPFDAFVTILKAGFSGGPYCNVAFMGQAPEQLFHEWEYSSANPIKSQESEKEQTRGDRYRLKIWSGFSRNFSPYGGKRFEDGTVQYAPPKHIEPFIVLSRDADVPGRIQFYKTTFEQMGIPCPAILNRDYEIIS